jgi:hypothetical protein
MHIKMNLNRWALVTSTNQCGFLYIILNDFIFFQSNLILASCCWKVYIPQKKSLTYAKVKPCKNWCCGVPKQLLTSDAFLDQGWHFVVSIWYRNLCNLTLNNRPSKCDITGMQEYKCYVRRSNSLHTMLSNESKYHKQWNDQEAKNIFWRCVSNINSNVTVVYEILSKRRRFIA